MSEDGDSRVVPLIATNIVGARPEEVRPYGNHTISFALDARTTEGIGADSESGGSRAAVFLIQDSVGDQYSVALASRAPSLRAASLAQAMRGDDLSLKAYLNRGFTDALPRH